MIVSLENVLGFKVRITNVLDNVSEGTIYSFNSENNTITLQLSKKNANANQGQGVKSFKIINCQFIKSLKVIGDKPPNQQNTFKKALIKPSHVSLERVDKMLNESIRIEKEKYILKGRGVSSQAQCIFDALHKTFSDTKWVGSTIVVLDDVEIIQPYKVENVRLFNKNDSDKQASAGSVKMIQRIVQSCWERLSIMQEDDKRKGG